MRSTRSSGRSLRQSPVRSQATHSRSVVSSPEHRNKVVGLGPAIFALLGALIFLAYPLTDARFREIVRELHARHGILDDRSDAAAESVDVTAPVREA